MEEKYVFFAENFFRENPELMENSEVKRLMDNFLSLQEQMVEAENGNTPIYCPTCGSCGEEGCCSPGTCEAVKCLYANSNQKSYYEMREENEVMWNFITKARVSEGVYIDFKETGEEMERKIEAIWDKTLDEHKKQN